MGLAAGTLLAVITLIFAVVGGGVAIGSPLLLVLSIAAVTSLLSRRTSTWTPARRRDRPGGDRFPAVSPPGTGATQP